MKNIYFFFLFLLSLVVLYFSENPNFADYARWIGFGIMIMICIYMFIMNKNSKLKIVIICLYFVFLTSVFFYS